MIGCRFEIWICDFEFVSHFGFRALHFGCGQRPRWVPLGSVQEGFLCHVQTIHGAIMVADPDEWDDEPHPVGEPFDELVPPTLFPDS